MNRSVVLFSGGIDSAVAVGEGIKRGDDVLPLFIDYGQRHLAAELAAAERVASYYRLTLNRSGVSLGRSAAASSLTGTMAVPVGRTVASMETSGVPSTYVPGRNTIMLALGLSLAEAEGASSVVIGANASDAAGYPDCREGFLALLSAAFHRLGNIRIDVPNIARTKLDVVRRALDLGVPIGLTWSCYQPTEECAPCGRCDACNLRDMAIKRAS